MCFVVTDEIFPIEYLKSQSITKLDVLTVVKFTHSILGLYPGVASSLVSRGVLGTLPGDSSWKTEEGSTEHFPRWLVFRDGRWTVTGQCLFPE